MSSLCSPDLSAQLFFSNQHRVFSNLHYAVPIEPLAPPGQHARPPPSNSTVRLHTRVSSTLHGRTVPPSRPAQQSFNSPLRRLSEVPSPTAATATAATAAAAAKSLQCTAATRPELVWPRVLWPSVSLGGFRTSRGVGPSTPLRRRRAQTDQPPRPGDAPVELAGSGGSARCARVIGGS